MQPHGPPQPLQILDRIADGVIAVDRDFRYVFVNEPAEALIGKRSDEILGKTIWEAFPESIGSEFDHAFHRAMAQRVPVRVEAFYAPLDTWFLAEAYPGDGGLSIVLRNVNESRRAAEALAARARQQAAIAEVSQHALTGVPLEALFDETARLTARTLDVELAKILELSDDGDVLHLRAGVGWRDGLVGTATVDARTHSQASYTLAEKHPVIVTDFGHEKRFVSPPLLVDHDVKSGMSVVIEGPKGPFGILGAHCKRPRVFTEDDVRFLASLANVLGLAIVGRAAQHSLQEARLAQATAEAAVGARDQVLAFVSHELRNPLGSIELALEALRRRGADFLDDGLDTLSRASAQMQRLIADLLDVSRIEAGEMAIAPEKVDLEGLLRETVRDLAPRVHDASVRLTVDVPARLPEVDADRGRIHQVLENLVTNALKHTRHGVITVRAMPVRDRVVVSVADTGSGMSPEEVPRLFDRFWQGRSDGRGVGLGLAIVKGLVEAHGGEVWAESKKGHGTTLFFTLPLARTEASIAG